MKKQKGFPMMTEREALAMLCALEKFQLSTLVVCFENDFFYLDHKA
jgi:hypothetical protein